MTLCIHDMNPAWCADCQGSSTSSELVAVRRLTARYGDVCAVDESHRIHPGDEIGVSDGDEYLCEGCCDG